MIMRVLVALFALAAQSCNNSDIPREGSLNDYEYTFEVSATDGDVHLVFSPTSDGTTPQLNGIEAKGILPLFDIHVKQGACESYRITTKGAREFGVTIQVMPDSSSGSWKFTKRRNGKLIGTDEHKCQGRLPKEQVEYRDSTK